MLSTLRDEIEDFPQGIIDRPEAQGSTDFVIKTSGTTIGIEVTRVVNPNYVNSTPLPAIRDAQVKCFRKAKQILTERRIPPLDVKVRFHNDSVRINIEEATQELCDLVQNKLRSIDDTKTWYYSGGKLKYISRVSIHLGTNLGKKWLYEHRVGRIHANRVNTQPCDIIQERIDDKHKKLANYQEQCDECWLIIGVNDWTAPEAITVEGSEDTTYFSDFARTYFVRGVEGRVWRLKTIPSE